MIDQEFAESPECLREEIADLREKLEAARAELQRLQSSPAPVAGRVPELTFTEYESIIESILCAPNGPPPTRKEYVGQICAAINSRIPTIKAGEVVRWIPVEESLPEDGATVGFITECARDRWYHGRVLGGRYMAGEFGGFSVPGLMVRASYWFPFPPIPDALRAQATTSGEVGR